LKSVKASTQKGNVRLTGRDAIMQMKYGRRPDTLNWASAIVMADAVVKLLTTGCEIYSITKPASFHKQYSCFLFHVGLLITFLAISICNKF